MEPSQKQKNIFPLRPKTFVLLLIVLVGASLVSSCTGAASTANSWPGLTVDEDTAYVAYNQHVYAVNLNDGKEKWRFPPEANNSISFFAPPVLTPDGQLLAGSYSNILYSIDPATGQEKWQFKDSLDRYLASPLATIQGIFAPTASESLYRLDLSGKLQWTFTTDGPQWSQPVPDDSCNCIYLASMDHYLYAVDTQTGSQKWKSEKLGGSIVGKPALSPEGTLFVGTFGKEFLAVDGGNGRIIWRVAADGWVWAGPVYANDRLYVGDLAGNFYALDATTGNTIWKIQPDGPIVGSPIITEEMIYFGTEAGSMVAVDLEGNTVWTKTFKGKIYSSPVLTSNQILFSPFQADEILIALDFEGNQDWVFIPENKK